MCILCRRCIGVCGARCDHIERIAENIAQHNRKDLRGRTVLCKPPALHGTHPLAQCIHRYDVRARGEQLLRQILQLVRRDQRLFKERTPTAREEEKHCILRREPFGQVKRLLRRRKRIRIRHGMSRLMADNIRYIALDMSILCNDNAALNTTAELIRCRTRHLPHRLADRDQHNAPRAERMPAQSLLHRRIRQNRRQ